MPVAPVPAALPQPTPLQLAATGPTKPVRATSRPLQLPAPSKGLDAITNLSQMDPASAIYLYNLNPTQFGCRVRPGYQNWATNVAGSSGVQTLISVRGGSQLKLFACTIEGIWDVTSSSDAPTKVVTFGTQTGNAGYGKYISVADGAGNPWVVYCDSVNGLYYYDVSTNTWSQITEGFSGSASSSGSTLTQGSGTGSLEIGSVITGSAVASVTATSASPAVFSGATLPAGTAVVLGGSVPTGFVAGTVYYVVSPSGSTFELAAVSGGTAINSTSTGSGVTASYAINTTITAGSSPTWTISPSISFASTEINGVATNQITGVNPATFTDAVFYAGRMMFVEGGTGIAWYINTAGALFGAAAPYYFGPTFPHGGNLNSVYTYTFESVFYLLQYLVTISDAGDVVLWQGTDITNSSDWALHGQWYVGDLPTGNRPAAQYGSDLIILSQFGAIAVSNLIQGVDINNPASFITEKIAPALVPLLQSTAGILGWSITPWPAENVLLINVPTATGMTPQQFVYNQLTKGWAIYQGIPMQCACNWDGVFYSATSDNRVLQNTGTQDNVATPETSGTPTAITFAALGAFNALGAPGQKKFIDIVRAIFVSSSPVSYVAGAQFDYNISEPSAVVPAQAVVSGGWDDAEWDMSIWSGGGLAAQIGLSGAAGIGSTAAFWVVGNASGAATLVGYEAMAHAGGFL